MNGTDIAGYLWRSETFCPNCIYELWVPADLASGPRRTTEEILDLAAAAKGINRHAESTFTSRHFPQPIYVDDVTDGDRCLFCGVALVEPTA